MADAQLHAKVVPQMAALKDTAHAQCDVLWDVVALLEAIVEVTDVGDGATEEQAGRMRRLSRVAMEQTKGVIDAFSPYI